MYSQMSTQLMQGSEFTKGLMSVRYLRVLTENLLIMKRFNQIDLEYIEMHANYAPLAVVNCRFGRILVGTLLGKIDLDACNCLQSTSSYISLDFILT